MTDLIKIEADIASGNFVDSTPQPTEAFKLFELAEAVYNHPDTILMAVNSKNNVYEQRVPSADNSDITLTIKAQKAAKVIQGIGLVFAEIGISEKSDEMYLILFRKNLRKYKFENDPYVEMFSSIFQRHLEVSARS